MVLLMLHVRALHLLLVFVAGNYFPGFASAFYQPASVNNASSKLTSLNALTSSWEHGPSVISKPYISRPLMRDDLLQSRLLSRLEELDQQSNDAQSGEQDMIRRNRNNNIDTLWEQIIMEAEHTLQTEPSAGPQLYTNILSQPSLLHAITTIISHEISTKLMPATSLQNLFFEMLDPVEDKKSISLDIMASAMRSPSIVDETALFAILFNQGLHALVCHRLSHRLWQKQRTGLAYYIQSTVSRKYSTDIHPAARFGNAIYLNAGSAGVVIGETAVIDNDVTILQGVTLGGTGKERGDRHPKVKKNAILQQHCSVLGNIEIGEGAIIVAKSIVTKPVPAYHKVSGVPARSAGDVKKYVVPEPEHPDGGQGDSDSDNRVRKIEDLLRKHSAFILDEGSDTIHTWGTGESRASCNL